MNDNEILEGKVTPETQETIQSQETIETVEANSLQSVKLDIKNDKILRRSNSSELTKTPQFKVTPFMEKWVNTAVELITDSPVEISQRCNISRQSWYQWNKLPGFNNWFYDQYKASRKRWIPRLDAMGMNRANKNFDYWKAMNQKAGDLLDSEHTSVQGHNVVSILGGMTINNINSNQTSDKQDT